MYSFYKISRIEHMKTLRYDACSGIANYEPYRHADH